MIRASTRLLLLAACVAGLSLPAAAASDDGFDRTGSYVHAGFSWGFELFRGDVRGEALGAPGVNVRAGARLHRYVALEAQLEYLHQFGATAAGVAEDISVYLPTVNVRLYPLAELDRWTFDQRIQVYLLGGVGAYLAEGRRELGVAFGSRFGLGVDVFVTRSIGIGVEGTYVLPAGDGDFRNAVGVRYPVSDLPYVGLSAALIYKF